MASLTFDREVVELTSLDRFRWVEYSLSSTLMMVLIAATTGVTDLAGLIGLAFANISMILFGWIMEMVNTSGGACEASETPGEASETSPE